jgi:methylenetetrahydrofolate reductase (NADPH)
MDDEPVSQLDRALRGAAPIITAEVTSPVGADAAPMLRRAAPLRGLIVAANVPDGQAVSAHMGPLAAARLLLEAGIEPVLTLQCRDRNRLALQSDLLAAAALGIRNVLCLTGDRPAPGSGVPGVFDLDSVALLRAARGLMAGRLLDGTPLRAPPRFVLGVAAHPFATDPAERITRLHAKADAGARFAQTQYVFDVAGFARWMEEVRAEGLHERLAILASVGAFRSPRGLAFVRALPGVRIPPEVEARLVGLEGDAFAAESLCLCVELARALLAVPGVRGIHLVAPYLETRLPEVIATLAPVLERSMPAL